MENDQSVFITSFKSTEILQGDIQSNKQSNEFSTLDEPVFQTIKRAFISLSKMKLSSSSFLGDLFAVFDKFNHVIFPRQSTKLLKQWDLWGPLILITTLAILLQSHATKVSHGIEFAEIFSLIFLGSILITVCN